MHYFCYGFDKSECRCNLWETIKVTHAMHSFIDTLDACCNFLSNFFKFITLQNFNTKGGMGHHVQKFCMCNT